MNKKHHIDLVSLIMITAIVVLILWIGNSLLGNFRFSQNIRNENKKIAESKYNFDELQKMNPDICAWLTIEDTHIDYPVVHTSNNMEYLTKSALQDDADYGAIFLDYRNSSDFTDIFSLIYGHHMSDGNMFGDVDKFKERGFFEESSGGVLTTPQKKYQLNCAAFLIIPADTKLVYDPTSWQEDSLHDYLDWISDNAMYIDDEIFTDLRTSIDDGKGGIVALSTCTSYDKNLRYVLILEKTAEF